MGGERCAKAGKKKEVSTHREKKKKEGWGEGARKSGFTGSQGKKHQCNKSFRGTKYSVPWHDIGGVKKKNIFLGTKLGREAGKGGI